MTTATAPARTGSGALIWVLRLLGAAALVGLAWIHWYLWQQGYDSIDVIGPSFLASVVLGIGGALLVLVTPLRWLPVAAVLGALLCLGTLGALIVSTTVGLFGFKESTAAELWWESFWVEAAGFVVLAVLAVVAARRRRT
ncbi:hypothetical protein ACI8AF_16730 [Blastococcus sp. SYSU D00669]